jgi:hypothetical protein
VRDDFQLVLDLLPEVRYREPLDASGAVPRALGRLRAAHDEIVTSSLDTVPWHTRASAGRGRTWANIPWIAVMDPRETTTAQRGRYLATLFAADGSALVLAAAWGTQRVRREMGAEATSFLRTRRAKGARALRQEVEDPARFTWNQDVDLSAGTPLARDYERSCLAWHRWTADAPPQRDVFAAHLVALARGLCAIVEE